MGSYCLIALLIPIDLQVIFLGSNVSYEYTLGQSFSTLALLTFWPR